MDSPLFLEKEISQNLELLFNPTNKQIRLEEVENAPDFKPYFNKQGNISVVVPGKKVFKATMMKDLNKDTYIVFSEDVPKNVVKKELVLLVFDHGGEKLIAQTEAVSMSENFGKSFITRSLYVKPLDPRRFKRKELEKKVILYTIPSHAIEAVKAEELRVIRRHIKRKTSHCSTQDISQDFFQEGPDEFKTPQEYFEGHLEAVDGKTLDISLGGIALTLEGKYQGRFTLNQMIYSEIDLHLRGIMRKIRAFSVVRHVKKNDDGRIFVDLMFLDSLPDNLFQ